MTSQSAVPSTIMSRASNDVPDSAPEESPRPMQKGPRFWAILVVLALISLLTSLEATITSTVLPSIVADLDGGENYIWIANAYFLVMAALQPMFGQVANVFGRRWPMIFSATAFMIGSGICGGAANMAMMIAGRAIQGIGGSGISVLCETIICDLVPLRERGTYMAMVLGMVSIGAALGPVFGGLLVTYSTWRWAFYLALPIGGVSLVLLFAFLHVQYDKSQNLAAKLSSLDWVGNAIFIGGTTPVLVALGWAGGQYPWSSYQVLVPLLVGLGTLGGFVVLEGNASIVPNPIVPLHLFANPTSAIAFLLSFLHGGVTLWSFYFLPVYFQGVLEATPYRSGIMLLPTIFTLIPAGILGGLLLTKVGRYKPIILVSFALIVVGFGLFSLLDETSSMGAWVGYQVVEAFGAGFSMAALLPALLAPLTDKDTALATGTWTFMRSFGTVWGVAVGGTIYTNRAAQLAGSGAISSNATVAAGFAAGRAYEDASAQFLGSLSPQTRAEVVAVQSIALRRSWQVAIAFGGVGLIAAALMKEIPLRKELETEFGMVEKERPASDVAKGIGAEQGSTSA